MLLTPWSVCLPCRRVGSTTKETSPLLLLLRKIWVGMGGGTHSRTSRKTWQPCHHWSTSICRTLQRSRCPHLSYRRARVCHLNSRRRLTLRRLGPPAAPLRWPPWSSRGAVVATCMSCSKRNKSPSVPNAKALICSISLKKTARTISWTAARRWGRNKLAIAWFLFKYCHLLLFTLIFIWGVVSFYCAFLYQQYRYRMCVSLLFFLLVLLV